MPPTVAVPRTIRNFIIEPIKDTEKQLHVGRQLDEIAAAIHDETVGWPRRVGTELFALHKDETLFLRDSSDLAAWLGQQTIQFDWRSNSKGSYIKMPSKADLMSYLKTSAKDYCSIQELPHHPRLPTAFYTPKADIEPKATSCFLKLLKFFKPYTSEDQIFLAALFLTPFWGGQPGGRPMFVIEGPENDPDGGRGVGKSELVDIVSTLAGGYIDVPEASVKDPDEVKKRILNNAGGGRIVRYDNVKKNRFSSSVFESLITSSQISGHMMYVGHGSRPNHYTYVVTFNDASLSKDLATRAVRIRLARPDAMDAKWGDDVRAFLHKNYTNILAEILWFLEQPSAELKLDFRFPAWADGVLAKVAGDSDQASLQKILIDKTAMDDEMGEIDDIEQVVRNRLMTYNFSSGGPFDPETQNMFVSWSVMARWLREDMGLTEHARSLSKKINRSGSQRIEVRRTRGCKGAMWVAPGSKEHECAYMCPPDWKVTYLNDTNLHKVSYNS